MHQIITQFPVRFWKTLNYSSTIFALSITLNNMNNHWFKSSKSTWSRIFRKSQRPERLILFQFTRSRYKGRRQQQNYILQLSHAAFIQIAMQVYINYHARPQFIQISSSSSSSSQCRLFSCKLVYVTSCVLCMITCSYRWALNRLIADWTKKKKKIQRCCCASSTHCHSSAIDSSSHVFSFVSLLCAVSLKKRKTEFGIKKGEKNKWNKNWFSFVPFLYGLALDPISEMLLQNHRYVGKTFTQLKSKVDT